MYGDTRINIPPRDTHPNDYPVKSTVNPPDHRNDTQNSHPEVPERDNVTELEIINAVERINHAMNLFDKRIRVMLRKGANGMSAHVLDRESSSLIRIISVDRVMELDRELQNKLGVFMDEVA